MTHFLAALAVTDRTSASQRKVTTFLSSSTHPCFFTELERQIDERRITRQRGWEKVRGNTDEGVRCELQTTNINRCLCRLEAMIKHAPWFQAAKLGGRGGGREKLTGWDVDEMNSNFCV